VRGEKGVNDVIVSGGGGTGPSTFEILFGNLLRQFLIPLITLAVLLIIDAIGNKAKHRAYSIFAVMLAICAAVGLVMYYSPGTGSVSASYVALAFVMTAVVFILNFIKLSVLDYAVLFACFVCVSRFVGLHSWLFGGSLAILYVFAVLLAICKIRLGRLNGRLFYVWFAAVLISLEGYVFEVMFDKYVRKMGYSFDSRIEKLIVWGIATLVIVSINLALIYFIKRLFQKRFDEINQMGKAYPRIERFFIYNSIGILLLIIVLNGSYTLSHRFDDSLNGVFTIFALFALIIQLSFLIMIFRITWLKDNLQSKTFESQSLATYSSSLEKNMNEIRSIKHDIKNIFLTMGSFVEQNGSVEMQAFYREKISPFAKAEIAKSDLFGKLSAIDSEHLKAFLSYKISQAVERGIAIELDISPRFSASGGSFELMDLVRILGILLDNAIEECMTLAQGVITLKLTRNDEMVSYMVKNTVSPERKETGIKAGVSSKNGERGKGLVIVRGLLQKYDCVTLNSYFYEDCLVQNLVVYESEK
jgi:hypothetical protein